MSPQGVGEVGRSAFVEHREYGYTFRIIEANVPDQPLVLVSVIGTTDEERAVLESEILEDRVVELARDSGLVGP